MSYDHDDRVHEIHEAIETIRTSGLHQKIDDSVLGERLAERLHLLKAAFKRGGNIPQEILLYAEAAVLGDRLVELAKEAADLGYGAEIDHAHDAEGELSRELGYVLRERNSLGELSDQYAGRAMKHMETRHKEDWTFIDNRLRRRRRIERMRELKAKRSAVMDRMGLGLLLTPPVSIQYETPGYEVAVE